MMTLDQAIKYCEKVAEKQEKLCKVNDSFNFSQPKWRECANEHRQLAEWLKELKKLREQTRWIPVTEDAPPKGTICLWCNKQGRVFTSEITYRSECSSYVGKHGYFSNGLENHGDIVAWMPLPKPYSEVEE
jgi:hypothetical protein